MILTVTPNPLLDYVLHCKEPPAQGGHRVKAIDFTIGGKGINVARMLKTLGRPALALTFTGGPNGEKVKQGLKSQGISFRSVETEAETRLGINYVVEEPHTQTWWIEEGLELSESEISSMLEMTRDSLDKTSFLALSGTIPGKRNQDFYRRIIELASQFPVEIFLDARGNALKEACRVGGFFLKHNREEAIQTFNIDPYVPEMTDSFIKKLKEYRINGCLVTDGPNKVLLWDMNDIYWIAPANSREVSSVGCGDATLAGILFGRASNMSLLDSIKWGLAAGAADAECPGPCAAEYAEIEKRFFQIEIAFRD